MKMLTDRDESIRLKAAKELGKLGAGAKAALPLLTKLKSDPDARVREAAATAIEQISQ
jgi:HEAT repeat protein